MWNTIKTKAELDAYFADMAKLDCNFARKSREFYETRTPVQLEVLAAQAWNCNEAEAYMLARSYRAAA